MNLTPHPFLVQWSRKSRVIPLIPLWAVRPVQSPNVCTRVHFTLPLPLSCTLKYFPPVVPQTLQRKTEEVSCHMSQPTFQIHNQIPTLFEVLRNRRLKKVIKLRQSVIKKQIIWNYNKQDRDMMVELTFWRRKFFNFSTSCI